MTITFANVTETKTKMSTLTEQALRDGLVILLKNGKPLLGLLDYKELEEYQKWKEVQKLQKKFQKWEDTLPIEEINDDQAMQINQAKQEIVKGDYFTLGIEDNKNASDFLGLK